MEYKLSDLFALHMGKTPARDEPRYWQNGSHPWISIADLSSTDKFIETTKETISDFAVEESKIYMIPEGTVVMSFKLSLGKVAITKKAMYSNEAIMAFVPRNGVDISTGYLYYLLKARRWDAGGNKAVKGITLNKATLSNVKLHIHTAAEQELIVHILDKLGAVIKHRRTQLTKLDELVKCRFVELFGDPLAPKAKWKTTSFGSEFEIFSGGTPSTSVSEYWDNGTIPWIGSNMCQDVILSSTDGKYITEEGFNKSSAKWAHAGYVIVALVGATIGKTALLTISTTTNQNVASVNVPGNTNYTPEYVYMLMRFLYAKFMELGNGGFKMANLGFIRQLPLPSPPIDLQREYSDFMNRIDKLRFAVQASLDKTQQLFDSLMQEYFG